MFSLKDITIYNIADIYNKRCRMTKWRARLTPLEESDVALLAQYNVQNLGDLEALIEKGQPQFQRKVFYDLIYIGNLAIESINKKKMQAAVFPPVGYEEKKNNELLTKTDELNSGRILIMNAPYSPSGSYLYYGLGLHNIATLKDLMSTITLNGVNAAVEYVPGIGYARIEQLAQAIDFYEKQIIRVLESKSYGDESETLFYRNREAKKALVREELRDILTYLFEGNFNSYIWGNISTSGKRQVLNSLWSTNSWQEFVNAEFVSLFTNYLTLEELKDGVRTSSLDRFVR